jgi:hypothetical protein
MSKIKVDSVETTDDTKDMQFVTNSTEAMRIDTDGNVGIGTDSPFAPLTVKNNPSFGLYSTFGSYSDNYPQLMFGGNASTASTAHIVASTLIFNNSPSSEAMRIDVDGQVGIGVIPAFRLDVDSLGMGAAARFTRVTDGTKRAVVYFRSTGNGHVGEIAVTNNSTAYETSSDYRLKTDAQPMTGASARVQALNPVNFAWIADGSRTDGFLAHEAQAVVPECASGTKDAVDEDGNPDYQGIDQSKLVPLLTAALQEALTRIEALESKS